MSALAKGQERFLLVAVWAALAACSGTPAAFAPKYPDNDSGAISALVNRVQRAPVRPLSSIAVGVTGAPQKLFGYDLGSRRVLWQTPIEANSAPHLAGNSVVLQSEDTVVGYDLRTGTRR